MIEISIIIPTHNSERTLRRCLDSIINQSVACSEIIIIDRFSRDSTVKLAREAGGRVEQAESNRSRARNIGLKLASTTGVLFVDSDMLLSPTLVEECSKRLEEYDALIVPEVSVGTGFWAECKSLERATHQQNDRIEAARAFLKTRMQYIGGYREQLEAGEDWDLHNRARNLGLSIGRTTAVLEHDEGHLRLIDTMRKKYRYGRTIGRYLGWNASESFSQINPLARILVPSLWIGFSDPVHGVGVLLLKTLEFTAAAIGSISPQKTDFENTSRQSV